MEKEESSTNQDAPSLHNNIKAEEDQLQVRAKVPHGGSIAIASSSGGGVGVGVGGDRLKRDEWSEGAVSSLLDAYESKWVLRNRAKLKGNDWEDVARYVSSRVNSTKSPKTQTQCKNKIESMKKRYRSESAAAAADASSSWPLFHRLDLLLRCRSTNNNNPSPPNTTSTPPILTTTSHPPIAILDQPPILVQPTPPALSMAPPPPPPPPPALLIHQNSHESNGVELPSNKETLVEGGVGSKALEDHESDRVSMDMDMDSSTPMSETVKDKMMKTNKEQKVERINKRRRKKARRRIRDNEEDLAGSIRWLAEVMVKAEQSRLEMIKEVEKMRVEAEAKRGEMDLKRTEIIANTQLQIAQILAGNNASNKSIDSALRIRKKLTTKSA
ncbi:hypothetical protein Syun_017792 [Stephania yunnanensis]|uniref:Myb/SANT-like DNA-binding domain-containing protein n=1 Tax=Stephania yunnanensis TaxID=152371 RepID=A0AAP0P5G5_9MAGN